MKPAKNGGFLTDSGGSRTSNRSDSRWLPKEPHCWLRSRLRCSPFYGLLGLRHSTPIAATIISLGEHGDFGGRGDCYRRHPSLCAYGAGYLCISWPAASSISLLTFVGLEKLARRVATAHRCHHAAF